MDNEILELTEEQAAEIRVRIREAFNPPKPFSYANGDHLKASIENEKLMREREANDERGMY